MAREDEFPPAFSQNPQASAGITRELPRGQDAPVDLADYAQLLWRRRRFIVCGTLLCGLAALIVSLSTARVYKARATLIVQPSLLPAELKPAPLSVETYRVLLESDFILDQTRIEMTSRQVISPDAPVEKVKEMLRVETYKDSRDTPLLDLWAQADSGEKASSAANIWAEVFLREASKLAKQRQQGSVRTIEAQYPEIQSTVAASEARLKARQDHHELALLELDKTWRRKLTEFAKETDALRNDHEKETARLRLEFENSWKPDLLRRRQAAQETSLLDLEHMLLDAQVRIKIKQGTLAKIKEELQAEPRYLVLAKAITDEALWDKIGSPGSTLPEALEQLKLRSEFLNPLYQDLLSRLTAAQFEYNDLDLKLARLPDEIERLRKETDAIRALAGAKENELSALVKDRELALNNLRADRDRELTILQRTYEEQVGQTRRDRDFEVEALTREAEVARTAYTSLAAKHQSAQLAKMEDESPVRLGALAVTPRQPAPARTDLRVATALVVGLILSILLAFLIEHLQSASPAPAPRSMAPGAGAERPSSGFGP
jgi:uncharacterized protein involved in exopolysaccharide biosynthesis